MQRVGGRPTFVEPKTERSRRTLALPGSNVAALRGHKVRQLEERLLAQGGHRRAVMEILGRSQIGLTMDTYSHVCR